MEDILKRVMNNMDSTRQLGEDKISNLLFKFSIPAIVGMLVNALYNVVDRIFIGNGVGSLGIAGITVCFPVMLVIMAFSMLVGVGANALVAIRLGEQRKEEAELIFGNAVVLLIGISTIISITGLVLLDPILELLGASKEVLPYARAYLRIILIGTVFQSTSMGMNNFIRSDGNPKMAMNTMLIGAVINTIFDPIFIFGFGWGMEGAALATIMSQFVSFIWVFSYFLRGKSTIKIRRKNLRLELRIIGSIFAMGFAPFLMQIAASLLNFIMNKSLVQYGGDIAISAMGIVNSILTLMIMPLFGINQGSQPIIGYNYGARQFNRVKETYKLAVIIATIITTFGFIIIQVFPGFLIKLFNNTEPELISFGIIALRRFTLFLPLIGFQIVSSNYFQAIGKPTHSALLSLSRQVLILIPLLLILPNFMGLEGVITAGPIADFLASMITGVFIYFELQSLKKKEVENSNKEDSFKKNDEILKDF